MRKFQKNKGITLIALIITVIVLLILAGVIISLVVGDNGVLTQSKRASSITQEKTAVEEVELAYSSLMSKYYEEYASNASVDKWSYVTTASLQAELNGTGTIIGEIEKNETTKEIEFTYDSGKNKTYKMKITYDGRVERVTGLSIPSTLALQKEENVAGTPTTITAVLDGITGQVNWTNSNSAVATISSTTGEQINVTPVSAGTTIITAECDGIEKQCEVTVLSRVAVTFKLNNSTDDVVENEFPGTEIILPVPTREGYIFVGWYNNQELTGNPLDGSAINTPNSEATYWAKWREPKTAFRTYGEPLNPNTYGNVYQLTTGNEKIMIDINDTPNDSTDDVEIPDTWKIFYEDNDFLYLIYSDYYPTWAQTNIDISSINLSESNSSYPYAVYDNSNASIGRANLLKYLKNNSSYIWDDVLKQDNFGINGNTYLSWKKLQDGIKKLNKMNDKTISIQGSPDIILWNKSWTASGNDSIIDNTNISNTYGYLFYGNNNSINVKNNVPWSEMSIEDSGNGYYDELFFPYRGNTASDGVNATKAIEYWLASSGTAGQENNRICCINCSGDVIGYRGYSIAYTAARPMIAIEK